MHDELQQRIRDRAYEIWEEEGRPEGRSDSHWHQAEAELAAAVQKKAPKRKTVKPAAKKAPAKKAPAKKAAPKKPAKPA